MVGTIIDKTQRNGAMSDWVKPTYLGITWNGGNTPPTPMVEISRDEAERLIFCNIYSLTGTNFEQVVLDNGSRPNDPMWQLHHYFYPENAVTVATRYAFFEADNNATWIPDNGNPRSGHYLRFFRLGCAHPNCKSEWVKMHDRRDSCPDCGFTAAYDTSG